MCSRTCTVEGSAKLLIKQTDSLRWERWHLVCVWSYCPAVQRVGCKQAKRPNVWAWVWKLMCFCEGKEKYVYVRLWGGRKSTQASAKSFGLLAHQGCGRIALITLHSGAQTHTHTCIQQSFQHSNGPRHIHTRTYAYPRMHTPLCVHKHKFQSVKNKSSQTKTYEMYKSELLYHSMQSATYYRRLPSVSPAKVPSLSSSVFLLLFLVLSFSLAL